MRSEILITIGTPTRIVLANLADFDGLPFPQTDQIDLTGLTTPAARQSNQFDFGLRRAEMYNVTASFEFAAAPVSGERVRIYVAPSIDVIPGSHNPSGIIGVDSPYTGTPGDSLVDSLAQLDYIASLRATSDGTPFVQIQSFPYSPHARYGTLVVANETSQNFVGNAVRLFVVFEPIVAEVQQ